MKVTILGCGGAGGVPLIGNNWGACDPIEPRNRRLRPSVLVEEGETTLLIDASPDLRQQLLACNAQKISAVLMTHAHADHCHGIDDLRSVNWLTQQPIDVYAHPATMKELEARFPYIFHGSTAPGDFSRPGVRPIVIENAFKIGDITITPYVQDHGVGVNSLGFRLNDFGYSTDVRVLDDAAFTVLAGIKAWVVDCMREAPHPTHSHLAQTLEWIAKLKPAQAYLTHMGQGLDYRALLAKLPPKVWPAHDGLVIEC